MRACVFVSVCVSVWSQRLVTILSSERGVLSTRAASRNLLVSI